METRIGVETRPFYRMESADLRTVGKRSLEWDLNDWKWDGDLFIATPMNPAAVDHRSRQLFSLGTGAVAENRDSSNSSLSCSDEVNLDIEKGKREVEKRRRVIMIEDDNDNINDGTGNLSLKLGGHGSDREASHWEGNSGKKTKLAVANGNGNRAVCQVEDCYSDLSNAKDYHRRHKVCELHSKATKAVVGNVMQRFCQQCSRFHALQEFDEGKRSCRRRLAGHNKRRRKAQPDVPANRNSSNDDQASGYPLISLLKILSNMHSNKTDETSDHELLSHLVRTIASNPGTSGGNNISGLIKDSQGSPNDRTIGSPEVVSGLPQHRLAIPSSQLPQNGESVEDATPNPSVVIPIKDTTQAYSDGQDSSAGGKTKLSNIDLNDIYIDSDDGMGDQEISPAPKNTGTSNGCPIWLQQDSPQSSSPPQTSSPPQASGTSDAASARSPSSSNGEGQSRTDRIVFKLFDKDPNDFPVVLRAQILNWLSHSPADIESYIRPGCVVMTIYLHLAESEWEELCDDLSSSLSRLLDSSDDTFWKNGWIYVRVQHQIAFIYNGEVVLDSSLPITSYNYSRISSVTPIAISVSDNAQFSLRGLNLTGPSTRLLCALEGKYLIQDATNDSDENDVLEENNEFQSTTFSCPISTSSGRGFFEVEDESLNSSFFPFIVADHDICSEIRTLENAIGLPEKNGDIGNLGARKKAVDFVMEMGWLLHRNNRRSRLGNSNPNTDAFPMNRFKWLIEFSMDHDWCAVVKKLLDVMLDGTVSLGNHSSLTITLAELGLLHKAVRRNSKPLVSLLLRYVPQIAQVQEHDGLSGMKDRKTFLFTPDAAGPGGLTPLHIAAGKDNSENVLDALLDDPTKVGIEAWKNARDSTGSTPEDYARLRGHYSYIHLVQRKTNTASNSGHIVLDIPAATSDRNSHFGIEKHSFKPSSKNCTLCARKRGGYGGYTSNSSMVYRPAMLSMVAIAAVCACVALLFKSSPEVLFVLQPFRWEMLDCGSS